MQNKGSLHNKFEGFGAAPSDKLWDSIASNLDQKKKRRAIFWWWFGSSIFAATALIVGLSLYQSSHHISESLISENHNSTENYTKRIKDTEQINSFNNKEVLNPIGLIKNEVLETKTNIPSQNITPSNKNTSVNDILNDTYQKKESIELALTSPKTVNNGFNNSESISSKTIITKLKLTHITNIPHSCISSLSGNNVLEIDKVKSKWAYSLFVQSHFKHQNKSYMSFEPQPQEIVTPNPDGVSTTNSLEDYSFSNNDEPNTRRFPSIRFGISKKLSKRFKFQTGLDLGLIRSQNLGYPSSSYINSSIYTIGVPIKINFAFVLKKRFDFYTDLGLVNDIPIFQISRTYNQNKLANSHLNLTNGFMGGIEFALGGNYKLNENFKLGIRTGYKHYYFQTFNNVFPLQKQNRFVTFGVGLIWNY